MGKGEIEKEGGFSYRKLGIMVIYQAIEDYSGEIRVGGREIGQKQAEIIKSSAE